MVGGGGVATMTVCLCRCVSIHAPSVSIHVEHHVVPVEWGGADGPVVILCPTGDHNVHELINLYVRYGGKPPGNDSKNFSAYIKKLASQAWENRPDARSEVVVTDTCCCLGR